MLHKYIIMEEKSVRIRVIRGICVLSFYDYSVLFAQGGCKGIAEAP